MRPKQPPFIEKCISLTTLSVNSAHTFSEMHLSYDLYFTTN